MVEKKALSYAVRALGFKCLLITWLMMISHELLFTTVSQDTD